jgi:hypothetical protein
MTPSRQIQITNKTTVSINLLITLLGVAFASGIIYMKINTFEKEIEELKRGMISMEDKIDIIHDYLRPSIALKK